MVFASISGAVPVINENEQLSGEINSQELASGQDLAIANGSLEGCLFQQRKVSRIAGWKRRYVVLNISDGGSFSCFRAVGKDKKAYSKVHQPESDKPRRALQSRVLYIPPGMDWIVHNIEDTASFVVDVRKENVQHDVDDDASVSSTVFEASPGTEKYLSAHEKDGRVELIFRCPYGSKEKSLWLEAFTQLGRLSTQPVSSPKSPSNILRKIPGSLVSSDKITGRARSAMSAKIAQERMFLSGNTRSSTTVALDEAESISRKVKGGSEMEFKVMPSYAYPNARLNRDELRQEMKKPSTHYHDLRVPSRRGEEIGTLRVEVLQCLGLPKLDIVGETDPVVYLVCGSYAFSTDTIPDVPNPMWLCKMRRACIFPLFHAYARLYVGVFDNDGEKARDDYAGRVVLDVARVRPGCTYDVMLPLRQSAQVYSRRQRGSVRLRFRVDYESERAALLSYLPKKIPKIKPNRSTTVRCCDETAFQNVALTVHGKHMQGHFSFKQFKATMREINFTRIMLIRLIIRPELKKLVFWEVPLFSLFLFSAWMHCVYTNSVAYVPGHLLTFLLLYLWKNYARYAMDRPGNSGFQPPTWEEMMCALVKGSKDHEPPCIAPLEMEVRNSARGESARSLASSTRQNLQSDASSDEDETSVAANGKSLKEIAEIFRTGVAAQTHRHRLKTYNDCFTGTAAVTFLVNAHLAKTRGAAVKLGRKLEKEFRLFEHVKKEHNFADERYFYRYLDVSLDKYVFKTHRPQGKETLRMVGLYNDAYLTDTPNNGHLEFPFSDFVDEYPKFTVKESLVPRLAAEKKKRKMSLLQSKLDESMEEEDDDEDDDEEFVGDLSEFIGKPSVRKSPEDILNSRRNEFPDSTVAISQPVEDIPPSRRPPPPQDMDVIRKSDKKLSDELQVVKGRLHAILFHWFNDKVFDIKDRNARFVMHSRRRSEKRKGDEDLKTQLDRSLQSGQFSHSNRAVARVGLFIEPIIGIALIFLSGIRALYNIFTWQDPMLSFWVSVICPIVVLVLHLVPWRIIFFLVGLIIFGPQNLILRVFFKEKIENAMSRTKKLGKDNESPKEEKDEPCFESNVEGNDQAEYVKPDPLKVQNIVVPYSPLMYQRFYDWPPEPEYASVKADLFVSDVSTDLQTYRSASSRSAYTAHSKASNSSLPGKDSPLTSVQKRKGVLSRLRAPKKAN